MSEPKTIENISDTAAWVAVYRALESERPDALFKDPFARLLAGERGERIVRSIFGGSTLVGWTIVVRTRLIDDQILRAVRAGEIDGVLNLASGLDTRPYRLALPREFKWWEVDLPAISAYKEAKLAAHTPSCRLTRRVVDLFAPAERQALFNDFAAECPRALVLTEGILMYLPVDKVDAIARELAERPAYRLWVQDYVAKRALQAFNLVWRGTLGRGGSRFEFLTDEGRAFFTKRGWTEKEFLPLILEADRLNRRPPLGKLAARFARLSPLGVSRDMGGILVLSR